MAMLWHASGLGDFNLCLISLVRVFLAEKKKVAGTSKSPVKAAAATASVIRRSFGTTGHVGATLCSNCNTAGSVAIHSSSGSKQYYDAYVYTFTSRWERAAAAAAGATAGRKGMNRASEAKNDESRSPRKPRACVLSCLLLQVRVIPCLALVPRTWTTSNATVLFSRRSSSPPGHLHDTSSVASYCSTEQCANRHWHMVLLVLSQ